MSAKLKKARLFSPEGMSLVCIMLLVLALTGCSFFGSNATPTPTLAPTFYAPSGLLHVQGTQLVDANGHTVVLRGADIGTPFSNMKGWQSGKRPTNMINSGTFAAMAQWHMNALRLQVSNWIYAKYPSDFLSQLDQIVREANQAGLYVVINLEDDAKGGSPYPSRNSIIPKTEDITFWKAIAAHYKSDPMVLFDLYNEPQEPDWNTWLHGGGTTPDGATIVGFQDLVNAVRSTGAQQIVILEPGSAGHNASGQNGTAAAEEGGWTTFPLSDAIKDPDTMYSLHVYQTIIQPASAQSAKWGPILNRYPLFYGEWAFLTNGTGKSAAAHCQGLPTNGNQANQVVENFLNYMASIHANWTAWQFAQASLVQNTSTYTPTTFPATLQCGNSQANVGMGAVVKQYLATHPA